MNRPRIQSFFKTTLFLLIGCAFQTGGLHAQEKLLDRPVELKVTNQQLKDVLNKLSEDNNLTFSYKSNILDQNRVITLTIPESTLREALTRILGEGYDLKEVDNYIVVRKKGMDRKFGKTFMVEAKVFKAEGKLFKAEARGFKAEAKNPAYRAFKTPVQIRAKKFALHESHSPEIETGKQAVRNIIDDMVKDGIITDKDHFSWFGLDNDQFLVDGHPVADSLHAIFKRKYIGPDGMGYYFGPITIHGRGMFFDRSDIYGSRIPGDPVQPKANTNEPAGKASQPMEQ